MSLEKELLEKGFHAHGPYSLSEVPGGLMTLLKGYPDSEEIRILRGEKARDDFKNYPYLCMIYVLEKA